MGGVVVGSMVVVGAWVVVGGVVDIVVTGGTVVGGLVGPCVVPCVVVTTVAGIWVVEGSSLSKIHFPSRHTPLSLSQSVPSSTFPFGVKKLV